MQSVMYAAPSKSERCIGIGCTGLDPACVIIILDVFRDMLKTAAF